MTTDIALSLGILGASTVLFVTEWIRPDVVGLLVLVALVLTGLISTEESISGFANPAVVTTWAVSILSAGLLRTGVAEWLGGLVLRLARRSETRLLSILTGAAAAVSAFVNNTGAAAMFLPVTVDVARRSGTPSSRLLLPMVYAVHFGGMLTLIGTSSNLVVAAFLPAAGFPPLGMFDFAPVALAILAAGIVYTVLLGRRLLPARGPAPSGTAPRSPHRAVDLYGLAERLAVIVIPEASPLVGRTIAESRIGQALGLNVLRVERPGGARRFADPGLILEGGDRLLVLGRLDAVSELSTRPMLLVENDAVPVDRLSAAGIVLAELDVSAGSEFAGRTLAELDPRRAFGLNVVALRRAGLLRTSSLRDVVLEPADALFVQGPPERLDALAGRPGYRRLDPAGALARDIVATLLSARVPEGSALAGRNLRDARLGAAFGISVLALRRRDEHILPAPDTVIEEGDLLVVQGRPVDLAVLRGLQALVVDRDARVELRDLEDGPFGVVEVMLSPHTGLAGRTLRQLRLREKYGVSVLAVWRGDRPYRSNLAELPLRFGDALLCHGPREAFEHLARDRDFVVLDLEVQETPRYGKAPVASLVMAAVVGSVVLGWLPITVASIAGVVALVLTRSLTMDEAYRSIEWRAVFLIAGMLPLGFAMERSGAAALLGRAVVDATGPLGPLGVLAGVTAFTLVINQFIPSAVTAVVMAPIALAAAGGMGVSPYPFVLGVAYAVASSFMTPVSHPANLLVMSPGGYRFSDYLRNGAPVSLLVLIVSVALLPLLFPF